MPDVTMTFSKREKEPYYELTAYHDGCICGFVLFKSDFIKKIKSVIYGNKIKRCSVYIQYDMLHRGDCAYDLAEIRQLYYQCIGTSLKNKLKTFGKYAFEYNYGYKVVAFE